MAIPKKLKAKAPVLRYFESRVTRMILWPVTLFFSTVVYYGWTQMSVYLADCDYLGPQLCPVWMYNDQDLINGWRDEAIDLEDPDRFEDLWNEHYEMNPDKAFEDFAATLFFCADQEVAMTSGYTLACSGEFVFGFVAGILFDEFGAFWTALIGVSMFFASWVLVLAELSTVSYQCGMFIMGASVNLTAFPSFLLVDMFPSYPAVAFGVVLGGQVTASGVMPLLAAVAPNAGFKQVMVVFLLCITLPLTLLYLLSMPYNRRSLYEEGLIIELVVSDKRGRWKAFAKEIMTPEYIVFTVWYTMSILMYNWYNSVLWSVTGHWPVIGNTVSWMYLAQGVFAVGFGWMNDITQTIPACFMITASITYIFGFLDPAKGMWTSMLSGVLMVLFNAHVFSTKYCYVEEIYDSKNFGKLAGFVGMVAGFLLQFNTLIFSSKPDYQLVTDVYYCLTVVQYVLLSILGYWQFRKKRSYKTEDNVEMTYDSESAAKLVLSKEDKTSSADDDSTSLTH